MGMYGIKNFEAVINPPQGMIMAIGAGEKRPYVINDSLQIATVMSATGSFDHRAIDGADGAKLMQAFKRLVENPLGNNLVLIQLLSAPKFRFGQLQIDSGNGQLRPLAHPVQPQFRITHRRSLLGGDRLKAYTQGFDLRFDDRQ